MLAQQFIYPLDPSRKQTAERMLQGWMLILDQLIQNYSPYSTENKFLQELKAKLEGTLHENYDSGLWKLYKGFLTVHYVERVYDLSLLENIFSYLNEVENININPLTCPINSDTLRSLIFALNCDSYIPFVVNLEIDLEHFRYIIRFDIIEFVDQNGYYVRLYNQYIMIPFFGRNVSRTAKFCS